MTDRRKLSRLLRSFYKAPQFIFRLHLDRLLGHRFLELVHTGRVSGQTRRTVLEVIAYDPERCESVVVSAYGEDADWYRNIAAASPVEIRQAGRRFVPIHRDLEAVEAAQAAAEFCSRHPVEARLVAPVLRRIGAAVPGAHPRVMLSSLPMVAFRPVSGWRPPPQ